MSVWRCRVCEGINQGGRTCSTCGSTVPPGEPLRAAVKARVPSKEPPAAPPPVPPTPRRQELRELPTLEEMLFADLTDVFESDGRMEIVPMPGGCLMGPVPRRRRRRSWWY